MPLTAYQHEVLQIIAANRSAQGHIAGAQVLHFEHPGWLGSDPSLTMHTPRIGSCLPVVDGLERTT
jgi:hypothetical protein